MSKDDNSPEFIADDPVYAATANSAVARCCEVRKRTREAALAKGESDYMARSLGDEAFRKVMLCSPERRTFATLLPASQAEF
jgi:hypothetical protein